MQNSNVDFSGDRFHKYLHTPTPLSVRTGYRAGGETPTPIAPGKTHPHFPT
jgi:hypothetical protein